MQLLYDIRQHNKYSYKHQQRSKCDTCVQNHKVFTIQISTWIRKWDLFGEFCPFTPQIDKLFRWFASEAPCWPTCELRKYEPIS